MGSLPLHWRSRPSSAPRWLPLPLALALFAGSLLLYFALQSRQTKDVAQTVSAGAEGAKIQLELRMEARIRSLARMARIWEISGAPAQAVWESNAASYVHDLTDVQALEWIDSTGRVRWIVPPASKSASLADLTLDPHCKAAMEQATRENQPVVTRTLTLSNGVPGFAVFVPITLNRQHGGYLCALFKAQFSLERFLPSPIAPGEAITVSEGGRIFYKRDADTSPVRQDLLAQQHIKLRGVTWSLRMWPTPSLASSLQSPLPLVVLCAGILCALLLGAVTFYAQHYSHQAAETSRANAALRAALDQVKTLEGLLPICCYCKRVRDDTGYWSQIDTYLRRHTKASLSHSYCPECAVKFYEECGCEVPDKVKADLAAGNFE